MRTLQVSLLGGIDVRLDGDRVSFASRRTEALFAYLAHTGTEHERDHLAELLWDSGNPTRSAGNLRVLLTNLRHSVGDFVEITRSTVAFQVPEEADATVDSLVFSSVVRDALASRTTAPDDLALDRWRRAATLCKGDFLERLDLPGATSFDHWLRDERTTLHDLRGRSLTQLAHAELAAGNAGAAVQYADLLIRVEPLREEAHRLMILARRAAGDDAGALRHFEVFDAMHRTEFGTPAGAETLSLVEDLTPRDAALRTPPVRAATEPTPPREPRRRMPWSRFAGRRPELAAIVSRYAEATAGRGNVVLVRGGPGSGKTMLLRQAVNVLLEKDQALVVLGAPCGDVASTGSGDLLLERLLAQREGDVSGGWLDGPMAAPVAERIRALASVDPAQPTRTGSILAAATAAVRGVASRHPTLLVLDDFQWAAPTTRNLVAELVRATRSMPLCILLAAQPRGAARSEARTGSAAWLLDRVGQTVGRTLLDLDRVAAGDDDAETAEHQVCFVRDLLATEQHLLPEAVPRELVRLGGGQPLITVELVRDLVRRGQVRPDRTGKLVLVGQATWPRLPDRIVRLLDTQLCDVPEHVLPLLEAAAAQGTHFDALLVADVCRLPTGEVLSAFGRVLGPRGAGIVLPVEGDTRGSSPTHRFRHPVMRDHLVGRLDPAEARHLQTRVATVRSVLDGEGAAS